MAVLRTVGYALPVALHAHVQAVAPTTHFCSPRMLQQTPRKRSRGQAAAVEKATSGELVTVLSRRDDDDEIEPSSWAGCTRRSPMCLPRRTRTCSGSWASWVRTR